jgi:hypothetical protein
VILAEFFRGPYDGETLVLPTKEPWPRFVIPKFGTLTIQYFYLLAGEKDEGYYCYLYEDE